MSVQNDYTRRTYDALLIPGGYEQITGLSAAKGLTIPDNCIGCLIQAEDNDVRWRADGTDPTDAVGIVLASGNDFWCNMRLRDLRVIETTASAKLNVHYFVSE